MSALRAAVNVLNDRLVAAWAIGEALQLAGGETEPPWVAVYITQIEAIRQAAEVLEILINRGIGVVDPDGKRIEGGNDQ